MAIENVETQLPPNSSSNIARRSLSIFSRRGYDAPSPMIQSLSTVSVAPSTTSPTQSQQSMHSTKSNSKKWRLRRQSEPKPSGTIIRLVPKESPPTPMSALEIEMATAPNEEILRNIGLSPEISSPAAQAIYFPASPTASPSRRMSKRERIKSQGEIVGRWKDGNVSWNSKRLSISETPVEERPKTSDGLPRSISKASARSEPPKLHVVIPQSSHRMFSSVPYLSNSAGDVPSESYDISPPSIQSGTSIESFQISDFGSANSVVDPKMRRMTSIRKSSWMEQSKSIDQLLKVPSNHETTCSSGSSSGSVSGDDEDISEARSHRSSVTSIESIPSSDIEKPDDNQPSSPKSPIQNATEPRQTEAPTSKSPSLLDLIHIVRTPSTQRPHRRNRSFSSGRFSKLRTLPEANEEKDELPPSPTLSEAERELERHLTQVPTDQEIQRTLTLSRQYTVSRKPIIPPKSEKRLSLCRENRSVSAPEVVSILSNSESPRETFLARSGSVRSTLSLILEEDDGPVSAEAAERVIFHILKNTADLDDLFNMSIINRGFYRIFKRHELELMETSLKNMSPAAWEFRMTSIPFDEDDSIVHAPQYTAASFYDSYMRDSFVVASIKGIILERCQSILRPSTVKALQESHNPCKPSRIDDALFRIWTFCTLFGCQKSREDDIATQMDWLRGGIEAHQLGPQSSFSCSDSLFMNSSLLICSEHFALGNQGGLGAEELYDMTEIWNCLRTISQGVIGHTEQARQFGVFDDTEIRGGDIDGEELMLEEWHNYLLTLGLPVILEVSEAATSLLAFTISRRNRWTSWIAPTSGYSRSQFLREAVSRLYEERICVAFSPAISVSSSLREMRRRRRESFALEIKSCKTESSPSLSFGDEILMSRANTIIEKLSSPSSTTHSTPRLDIHPAFRSQLSVKYGCPSSPDSLYSTSIPPASPSNTPPSLAPLNIAPLEPESSGLALTGLSPPPPNITILGTNGTMSSPPTEPSHYEAANQHPFQFALQSSDSSMHSPERAIFRIVEMGFTAEEAKMALKLTDLGDGLRIDRAVEYLLRR